MNLIIKHKAFWWVIAAIAILAVMYFNLRHVETAPTNDTTTTEISTDPFTRLDEDPKEELPATVKIASIPFSSQAPFGDWDDPRQQDGCEEASILMASLWATGKTSISKDAALAEILALSARADEMLGTYHDSSAEDTLKLYNDYFNLDGEVKSNPTIDDIRAALAGGKLVAVPADGRKLGNPNFTGGGPDRHFLVIIGYDNNRKMFITHDPGTRQGANYQYSYDVLMSSLVNYPTGDHKPIFKTDTAMIIFVKKV